MNEAELRQLIQEVWDSSTGVTGGAGLAYSSLDEFEQAVLASSVGQQAGDLDESTLRQAISNGLDVGMTMLDVASDDEAIVRAATGQEQVRAVEDFVTPFERDIYLMQLRENAEASGATLGNSTDEIMESLGVDSDLATLLAQGRAQNHVRPMGPRLGLVMSQIRADDVNHDGRLSLRRFHREHEPHKTEQRSFNMGKWQYTMKADQEPELNGTLEHRLRRQHQRCGE